MECASLGKIALNAPLFALKKQGRVPGQCYIYYIAPATAVLSAHANYHNCASYERMNNKRASSYSSLKSNFLFVHRTPAAFCICIGYSYTKTSDMSALGYRYPAFCNNFDYSALHVPSPRTKKLPLKSSAQNIRTWPAKLLTRCFLSAPSNPRHRSAPPRTRNAETKEEPLAVKEKLRYYLSNQDTAKLSMQSLS